MPSHPVAGSRAAAIGGASFAGLQRPPRTTAVQAGSAPSGRTLLARAALGALVAWMAIGGWDIVQSIVEQHEGGWHAAAVAVAILLSALVSSIAGFAFCAIAGSALAYLKVEPVRAVQMMVLCSIATQFYAVWSIRASIRWRGLLPMIAAGAATVPLGVWLLLHVEALVYAAGLGAFLVAYGCYIALRTESLVVRGGAWRDAIAGALGGLAGGLAGVPGSFVTIWCSMRGWDKLKQRAVYQPYILAMQMVALACLWWQKPPQFGIGHDIGLVPFALIGAIAGLAVFRAMSNRQFQVAVSVLLVLSGLGLLGRAL